jgi:hypothetical protein
VLLLLLVEGPGVVHLAGGQQRSFVFLHNVEEVLFNLDDPGPQVCLQHILNSFHFHSPYVQIEPLVTASVLQSGPLLNLAVFLINLLANSFN